MKTKSTKLWDNNHLGLAMKSGYWNKLVILPIFTALSLVFTSILWGIPNIGWWTIIPFIFSMSIGMWLGWQLNMVYCYVFLRWPWKKVDDCFRHCKLPDSWLSEQGSLDPNRVALGKWEKQRAKGKMRYIFLVGVCGWGVGMTGGKLLSHAITGNWEAHWSIYLIYLVVNAMTGVVFGLCMWHFQDRQFRKLAKRFEDAKADD